MFRLRRWRPWIFSPWSLSVLATVTLASHPMRAADEPFLVTYSHQMEEPGNLEIEAKNVTGRPNGGNPFLGTAVELEYSVTGRWTTSVYIDGQATGGQSAFFTGYRWENRFRLLRHNHWINPVLYAEYANLDAADKTLVEVVGRDGKGDLIEPNQSARRDKAREIEARLILGSSFKGWTLAENLIAEKNSATHQLSSVTRWASVGRCPSPPVPLRAICVPRPSKRAWSCTGDWEVPTTLISGGRRTI